MAVRIVRGTIAFACFRAFGSLARHEGALPRPFLERFRNDAAEFLARWDREAKRLGWSVPDLFGSDPTKPVARYHRTGLLWALQGEAVVELTGDSARLSGGLTLRRRL